ncbi:endonuclease [Cytophagales bacterium LB-30]|uniref:Endonuclease n=1 Tax=Shiella aurantiaca TaxID=3058365 RepID=A0ABT8F217_9BACT|nr:endonuclease [Shiella aurantiaca]MDN4164339.1 endonuclease [Shiella aurantiaca]
MRKHFLNPKRFNKPTFLVFFLLLSGLSVLGQIPSGYYSTAEGKSGFELKTALYNVIKGHSAQSYASLWTHFQNSDKKANGKVWDMYSDVPGGTPAYEYTFVSDQCGNYGTEGDCYNREHSFPKSWFSDAAPMESDMFHLVPSDGYVNGRRGNLPYGETNNASWTSTNGSKVGPSSTTGFSGTVFEPIDEYKGDLARGYFYMATRYENIISGWPGSEMLDGSSDKVFTDWALTLLKAWHEADPVSQKEIDRNNVIYGIQNNRNPFIDHPEWVNEVWNGTTGGGGNNGGNNEAVVFEQNFDNCNNLNGWSQFSVSGDQVWECSNFGNNSTTGVRMNGFANSASNVNEDWLISSPLTIASGNNLNFDVERRFDGPDLQVKISSDYSGTGSPASATWTDLSVSIPAPAASNDIWSTVSGIDVSSFAGSNRYIAFVYTSTATNSSRFTLDNVTLSEAGTGSTDPTLSTSAPASGFNFGYVVSGNSSTSQSYTLTAANLTGDVSLTTAAPFAISTDNTNFSTALTIPQASANGATIHVRFSPTTADGQVSNGTISHATAGVTSFTVALTGTEGEANTNVQTIQSVRDAVDANGLPTTTGEVTVAGRVHGVNLNPSTTGNFQFSLIDATGAITIRNGSGTSFGDIQEGDDIEITGTIGHFNGLMQLSPTQNITVVSTGNARYTPVTASVLNEDTESQLVQLSNVSIPNPAQWTGSASNTAGFNVEVVVGSNTYTMRIDRNTELSKLTYQQVFGTSESGITLIGLGGQFDNSDPRDSGYQIFPYQVSDVQSEQSTDPTLSTSAPASGFNFGYVVSGNSSTSQSYTLTAANLTGDVSLTTAAPFAISTDNTNFSTALTIPQASANGATIHVRFSPTTADGQVSNGTISHATAGVTSFTVALTGTEGEANTNVQTIQSVRDAVDANGLPTTTGEVTVAGRVHGVNLNPSTTGNFQFSLIDATGAITIRNGSGTSFGDIQEGDDIEITGTIGHFNGLMQLSPTQNITVVSTGNARYTPVTASVLNEDTESQLVQLSNVSIPNPAQWTGSASNTAGFNVDVLVGDNTYTMRIDRNTELSKLTYQQVFGTTESGISIIGLGGQFDNSDPRDAGYQFFPYQLSDIDAGQGTNPILTGTAPAAGIDFGRIVAGQVSESQNYTLVASNLTADVSLSVTSSFQISIDNTNWSTNLTIAQASANGATVYVRFVPTVANAQLYTGTITHTSAGVADYQVGVFGQEGQATGGEASFLEDFNDCVDIAGWVNYSVLGDQVWECNNFGNGGTPGVRMNGFAGQSNPNEDWLISPELTISTGEALSFDVERRFAGPDMEVKISSNYSGTGDPSAATWETLPFTMPAFAATNDVWNTLETDISAYAGSGKYIAFVYYSTSEGSSRFTIDNVRVGFSAGNAIEVYFPSKEYFVTENTTTPITLQLAKPAVSNEQVIISYQVGTNVSFGAAGDVQTTPAENGGQITLNVTEGAQSVSFLVKANDDVEVEERETITFSILTTSGGLRAQAGNESALVNIIDNNPTDMSIKAARQINAKGLASKEYEVVRLQGVVHGVNWAANRGKVEFVIIDPAAATRAGIVVRANGGYTVTEGDVVQVEGSLRTDKGLQYIAASAIEKQAGAGTLVVPVEVDQLDESREADLVSLYGLQIMSGWGDDLGGYYEVIATNGVKQYLIRIDANTDIFEESAPEAFSISGFVWQRDTEAPYDGEYYLVPRSLADFSFLTAAPDALENTIKVYPNPSEGVVQLSILQASPVQVFDIQGHEVFNEMVLPNERIDLRHLNNGIYFLRVQVGKSTISQKLIINK